MITKLVARSDKGYEKICKPMWLVLENEKPYKSTSGKTDNKWGTRETMDVFDSWLYHEVTISNRKECNFGSL